MRHDFLDRYSRISSPVHHIPAAAKLSVSLCLLVALVSVPLSSSLSFALAATILLIVAALSRIPPGFLVRRILFLEPFVLGVAFLAIFQENGWRHFLSILLRSTLCLLTVILLSNTTPFAELMGVLRRMRVPALLITILALMYRYLFVLVDESERMARARNSRTFTSRRIFAWTVFAGVAGQLFIRSTERAERIYAAMCARGWK